MEFRMQACVGSDIAQLYSAFSWCICELDQNSSLGNTCAATFYIFSDNAEGDDTKHKNWLVLWLHVYGRPRLLPLLLRVSLQQINPGVPIFSWCFPVSPKNHWAGNFFLPCYWCQNNSTVTRPISAMVGHFWFSWGYFHGSLGQHSKRGILKPSINTYIQINTGSSGSQ